MTITMIMNEIKKLRAERAEIDKKISALENELIAAAEKSQQQTQAEPKQQTQAEPKQQTQAEPKQQTQAEPKQQTQEAIQVNEAYLNKVYRLAERLEDDLGIANAKLSSSMKNILEEYDADDIEESINNMHSTVLNAAYMLDTHVSSAEWKLVEDFISNIGYEKMDIRSGESILPYRTFFARPIGIDGGPKNTIKSIQKMPYIGRFHDGFETIEVKLCGKCVYYK